MQKFSKRISLYIMIVLLSLGFAGCSNEKQEKQDAYRKIGIRCMEEKDYEGAIEAFDNALSQKISGVGEEELDICYYKAAAQYANGDTQGAIGTYGALLDYDSKNAKAYYLRGSLYLVLGDTAAAQADYNSAVTYDADDYELYVNIAEQLEGAGLTKEATDYLNRALEIGGDTANAHLWKGRVYQCLEEYENAETELKAALEKKSQEANLYLAQVYDAKGEIDTATTYYQAYLDSGKTDSEIMYALGKTELQKENYAEAITYFQSGLEMEKVPNRQKLMQNLIIAYEKSLDFSSARTVMQQYLEEYPEDEEAQRESIFLNTR